MGEARALFYPRGMTHRQPLWRFLPAGFLVLALSAALLACSATAFVGFVFHQRRGARPLMELRLFGHRNFALGGTVAFIYGMALFGSTYLVPVFMQIALRMPPSQAGGGGS